MNSKSSRSSVCHVCGKTFPIRSLREWSVVRPSISTIINRTNPGWEEGKFVCQPDLAAARRAHVEELLEEERGELGKLDHQLARQWEKLTELQQVQIDMLEDGYRDNKGS